MTFPIATILMVGVGKVKAIHSAKLHSPNLVGECRLKCQRYIVYVKFTYRAYGIIPLPTEVYILHIIDLLIFT